MEGGDGEPSAQSSSSSRGSKSMTSSTAITGTILPPTQAPVGVCSETAKTADGKRLKIDPADEGAIATPSTTPSTTDSGKSKSEKGTEAEDQDDNGEAGGGGSGMPLVCEQFHPLQNPVILAHLFGRCPSKFLAKFRLVSKQWLDLSLTSWRATSQLLLTSGDKHPTIQQYLEFMNNPENKCGMKPHRTMKLVYWENDMHKERLQSFWNQVGRNLTSLELNKCNFPEVDDLRRIIFVSCPNLKRLCFHDCRFFKSARGKHFSELKYSEPQFGEQTNLIVLSVQMPTYGLSHPLPIHWLEMLSHFPSLTSLKVSLNRSYLPRTESVYEELFKAIGIIRHSDARKLCIRSFESSPSLKFSDDLGLQPDLSYMEELQLPLQFLEIEVDSNHKNWNLLLEDVLNRHRYALLRITVIRDEKHRNSNSPDPYSWGFPCNGVLERLEELRIHNMLCTNMKFLKNMPKLKNLEFLVAEGYGYSKDKETRIFLEPDSNTLLGVKLLHLTEFRMDYRVTVEDVTSFAGMMPNVRKLIMSLSDALFATVCRYWKDLKEVDVLGGDLTDKGVTGLNRKGKKIAQANITNLQDLESFKFCGGGQCLTDLSVFQGFLKLPSLKVLEVKETAGMMPFGDAARKALQDRNIDLQGDFADEWEDCEEDCNTWVDDSDQRSYFFD